MYKISEFAQLMGVTPKALRLYEEKGLLIPTFINSESGYRYYDSIQIKEVSSILELKNLGFTLEEIALFKSHKLTIDNKLEILNQKKQLLDSMIKNLAFQKTNQHNYSAYYKTEKPLYLYIQNTFSKTIEEMKKQYSNAFYNISKEEITLARPTYAFIEFTDEDIGFANLNCQICISVVPSKNENIVFRDETIYIATIHSGPYSEILKAYDFLRKYISLNNLEMNGYPSERYLDLTNIDINCVLTEVRFPIKRKTKNL